GPRGARAGARRSARRAGSRGGQPPCTLALRGAGISTHGRARVRGPLGIPGRRRPSLHRRTGVRVHGARPARMTSPTERALAAWTEVLGTERTLVGTDPRAQQYARDVAECARRTIAAVLSPESAAELQAIVRVA